MVSKKELKKKKDRKREPQVWRCSPYWWQWTLASNNDFNISELNWTEKLHSKTFFFNYNIPNTHSLKLMPLNSSQTWHLLIHLSHSFEIYFFNHVSACAFPGRPDVLGSHELWLQLVLSYLIGWCEPNSSPLQKQWVLLIA